jgi:hypothetical protein
MSRCKSNIIYPNLAFHIIPGYILTGIWWASVLRAFLMPLKMTHWKNTKFERVEQGRNCIPDSGCLCHLALGMSRKISWVTCCTLPTMVSCTSKVIDTTACKRSIIWLDIAELGKSLPAKPWTNRCTNGCGNSLVGGWHRGWATPMMLWYQPKLMLWLFYW